MSASQSTYFHCSPHTFGQRAQEEVLREFRGRIKDVLVKCQYDAVDHVFEINCPSHAGPKADEVLAQIIKRRIEEYDAAEVDQEDDDGLVRFPDSKFDTLDSVVHGETEQKKPPRPEQRTIARTHIVVSDVNLIKVFRMRDLYEFGLLARSLAPQSTRMQKLFGDALTCRAARFDPRDGHVFNGRTGRQQRTTDATYGSQNSLVLPDFGILRDDRLVINEPTSSGPVNQWEMEAADEDIGVGKWLAGVGRTRDVQVDPLEEKPDLPKDAKQMLAKAQTHAMSRARVARGANLVSTDAEDSSSEEGSTGDFNSLLAANRPSLPAPKLVSKHDSDETDSVTSDKTEKQRSFQSLLPGGNLAAKKRRDSGDWSAVVPSAPRTARPQAFPKQFSIAPAARSSFSSGPSNDSSSSLLARGLAVPSAAVLQPGSEWARYGNHYAKTDKVGLVGNVSNHSRWEIEHDHVSRESRKPNAKSKPIAIRSATPPLSSVPFDISGEPTAIKQGNAPSSTAQSTVGSLSEMSSVRTTKSITCYEDWDPSEAEWKNLPGAATGESNVKLVDDRASPPARVMTPPPGYLTHSLV